ncbi:MAG: hypothetical protein ABSC14_07275 [Desulfomonilia bacterium]|jgi:hypothetical protein
MKFHHHDLEIELDDTWWEEADMKSFTPSTNAYYTNIEAADGKEIFTVKIVEVSPVRRNPGVGIFNNSAEATAKDRVISILTGFRTGSAIPPVEVVSEPEGSNFRYKLVHGTHRFYCSLAAGFSHVPAIKGFDINTLDS